MDGFLVGVPVSSDGPRAVQAVRGMATHSGGNMSVGNCFPVAPNVAKQMIHDLKIKYVALHALVILTKVHRRQKPSIHSQHFA